jgi:hypothetical protein
MRITREDNVFSMQSRKCSSVVTMPSRNRVHSSAVVITMPSHGEQQSKVVTLPARTEATFAVSTQPSDIRSIVRSGYGALSAGVRMTLVALFALLGWPHPTRDNDPGPSAARPCHWERTSLISRLRLPSGRVKAPAASALHVQSEGNTLPRAA